VRVRECWAFRLSSLCFIFVLCCPRDAHVLVLAAARPAPAAFRVRVKPTGGLLSAAALRASRPYVLNRCSRIPGCDAAITTRKSGESACVALYIHVCHYHYHYCRYIISRDHVPGHLLLPPKRGDARGGGVHQFYCTPLKYKRRATRTSFAD